MTVQEVVASCGFEVICGEEALEREVSGVFCCDLLSWSMSRAPANYAWVTVMGNINALAVAALADSACIVLAENAAADGAMQVRAEHEDIALLRSPLPEFETALAIHKLINPNG